MATVHPAQRRELLADLAHAHSHAAAALDDPQVNSLAAVAWSSAHLASAERVLYPVAARVLDGGPSRVDDQRAVDHELQHLLWRLDRRLTGDVHLRTAPVDEVEEAVRAGLRRHADGEHALVADLQRALTPERQDELAEDLARALVRAPTRPHPHTPRLPWTRGVGFWLCGLVDRQRDVMDSRTVPTPHRTPVLRPMTRWGVYALGAHQDRPAPPR